jgi:hypothetical protein
MASVRIAGFNPDPDAFLGQINQEQIAGIYLLKRSGHQFDGTQLNLSPVLHITDDTDRFVTLSPQGAGDGLDALTVAMIRMELMERKIRTAGYLTFLCTMPCRNDLRIRSTVG